MNTPVLLVAIPLLGAFLLQLIYRSAPAIARFAGPAVLLINLLLALNLTCQVTEQGPVSVAVGGFLPPLGISFYADLLGSLFAVAVSAGTLLLWPRDAEDPAREGTLTLALAGAGSGLALSGDLFNLFVFYEVTAVASYGLAASRGGGAALAASLRYLILSATGSAFALIGIGLIYSAAGTLNLAHLALLAPETLQGGLGIGAFLLLAVGFGVKAELFPVNTWVPEVYATTSARVAALLAGLISKLAMLVLLRVAVLLFDGGIAATVLISIGVLGVVAGELAAYRARDLRRMLSYSSIGQLGMVAVAVGLGGDAGLLAAVALMLHHLLVKPALFLLGGEGCQPLEHLNGLARRSPLSAALFVLLGLSLIGVPPLPGFWAKYLLLSALLANGSTAAMAVAGLILAATVVEAAYLMRFIRRLFDEGGDQAPAFRELLPATALGAALLAATVTVTPLGSQLALVAGQAANSDAYIQNIAPAISEVRP